MSLEPNFECLQLQGEGLLHPVKIFGKHLGRKREFLLDILRKTMFITIPPYGSVGTILMQNIHVMHTEICRVTQFGESQTVKTSGPDI